MTPALEMFMAVNIAVVLGCWKVLQTLAYLADHNPPVILPPRRPRPVPRRIEPLLDISAGWSTGVGLIPGVNYRDDSETAE
jgi:hypothetical protein